MACGPCFSEEDRSSRQRCVRPTSATDHFVTCTQSFVVLPVALVRGECDRNRLRPNARSACLSTCGGDGSVARFTAPHALRSSTVAFRCGVFGRSRGRSGISSGALVIEPLASRRVATWRGCRPKREETRPSEGGDSPSVTRTNQLRREYLPFALASLRRRVLGCPGSVARGEAVTNVCSGEDRGHLPAEGMVPRAAPAARLRGPDCASCVTARGSHRHVSRATRGAAYPDRFRESANRRSDEPFAGTLERRLAALPEAERTGRAQRVEGGRRDGRQSPALPTLEHLSVTEFRRRRAQST